MRRVGLRLRLTAWYAGVLIVGGALVLGGAYLVVRHNVASATDAVRTAVELPAPGGGAGGAPGPPAATPGAGELVDAQAEANARALQRTLAAFLLGFSALVVLALAGGWVAAGRALTPLRRVTAAAGSLSAAGGTPRIALPGPRDELRDLADAFDAMADRVAGAFESQRRFVADAAHELRTPLALMAAEVDVALADDDADREQLAGLARRVRGDVDHLDRLVTALLALAAADRGVRTAEPVDLAAVVAEAVRGARSAGDPGVELHLELEAAPTTGDPHLLRALVDNVLENAVRHNTARGLVRVRTSSYAGHAVLHVENTGPVVDGADVAEWFRPFVTTRPESGSGIGLAIVRAVTVAHGGCVRAVPRGGGGLALTVDLPAPGPPAPGRRAGSRRATPRDLP